MLSRENKAVRGGGDVTDGADSTGDRTRRWEPFRLGVCAGRANDALTYSPSQNTCRAAVAADVVAREPLHVLDDGLRKAAVRKIIM